MFGGKKKKILSEGVQARAIVTQVQDTGVTVNNNPRVKLTLEVMPEGAAPFEASKKVTVSRVSIPQPGAAMWVRYDPEDPSRIEFDTAKVEEVNSAARAQVAAAAAAQVPPDLANGTLGRAGVVDVQKTPAGSLVNCDVTVNVRLVDRTPPYRAVAQIALDPATAERIVPQQTICTVRADPQDHSRVAISLADETPVVEIDDADVVSKPALALQAGEPCTITVLVRARQFLKTPNGDELWAAKVRVREDSSEFQTLLAVPPNGAALFAEEGRELPAKRLPAEPSVVAIDWQAAGSQAGGPAMIA